MMFFEFVVDSHLSIVVPSFNGRSTNSPGLEVLLDFYVRSTSIYVTGGIKRVITKVTSNSQYRPEEGADDCAVDVRCDSFASR